MTMRWSGALALASVTLAGCGASEALSRAQPRAPAEKLVREPSPQALDEQFDNGMALQSVETLALSREVFQKIAQYDPYQGLARLSDGRCIMLRNGRSAAASAGSSIWAAPGACSNLPAPEEGYAGLPCDGKTLSSYVGDWRLRCERLGNGRSALVAVGARAQNFGQTVTLAVLNEDVRLFKVFNIHSGIADVTTLGWGPDGKAALSSFSWIGSSTRIEEAATQPATGKP